MLPSAVDASVEVPDAGLPDAGLPEVVWTSCPLHTGDTTMNAQCATLLTPLNPSEPNGALINYFVKRFRPVGGRGLRQLWMIQGGPGASGLVFENLSQQFATRFPDVDYYFPDHRGTGRSSRIDCAVQESPTSEAGLYITNDEWPACMASVQALYGDALGQFNVTNAANDLNLAIRAMAQVDQPAFIYGVSYGTSVAHRYLQLFPEHVNGVVLDSIAPPGISLYRQDEDANEAARDYFNACAADPVCGAKLGPNAWQRAEALFAKLKTGHCSEIAVPGVPTHLVLRRAFGGLLMDGFQRGYIAPIVYRADRCEPRDITALKVTMAQFTGEGGSPPLEHQLWGWVLSQNILHSEFSETPLPTPMQLNAIREASVASRDVTEGFEATLNWPRYPLDAYAGAFADTTTPLLMLQGGLDPATLLRKARVMQPKFTRPNQTWVEFPTATHTTLVSSPYVNEVGERRSCGTVTMMRFLEAPTSPLDTSCVAKVLGIDWSLPSVDYNRGFFGTDDAWE